MTTIADVYPGSYGDSTLPHFDLNYMSPFPDAVLDLAADNLALGPLNTWFDLVSNFALPKGNGKTPPTVVMDGGRKVVRFNGTTDQMLAAYALAQPLTMILVGRTRDSKPNNYLKVAGINIATNAANTGYTVVNGTGPVGGTVSTGQHIFVASVNGASSVANIDGIDYAGAIATSGNTYVGFGTNTNSSEYMAVDIERFILIPYAATKDQRRAINAEMTARYS